MGTGCNGLGDDLDTVLRNLATLPIPHTTPAR